jgi:hypothetical protein
MPRGLTCKDEYTSNLCESREVLKQNRLNFAKIFCALIKNFLAFSAYFLALPQTCQRERKPTLILPVHVATASKRSYKAENSGNHFVFLCLFVAKQIGTDRLR